MKKLIAMLLALTCVFGLVACGGNATNNNETPETTVEVIKPASALEVLEKTWAAVEEDSKFPVMGGDFENLVDGAPGNYSLTDEGLSSTLLIPEAEIANVDQVASVVHAMMLNNFTGAVYHVSDSANVDTFVEALKASLASTHWVCGQPEVYTIITIDNFVVAIYGLDMIATDLTNVIEGLYDNAIVACKEAVM